MSRPDEDYPRGRYTPDYEPSSIAASLAVRERGVYVPPLEGDGPVMCRCDFTDTPELRQQWYEATRATA